MMTHGSLIIAVESMDDFPVKFGHSDQYSMSDVLWTCSNMLSDR